MRISRDEWGLRLAEVTALRGTCLRRQVGCVLVDYGGRVLATGYNGVPRGMPHCNEMVQEPIYGKPYDQTSWIDDPERKWRRKLGTVSITPCVGFTDTYPHACTAANAISGTQLDGCEATHAEINAMIQCQSPGHVHTAYVTSSPCIECTKALMNTGCFRVVFRELYPHATSEKLWTRRAGAEWLHLSGEPK